jgi:hypothetical protein
VLVLAVLVILTAIPVIALGLTEQAPELQVFGLVAVVEVLLPLWEELEAQLAALLVAAMVETQELEYQLLTVLVLVVLVVI